MTAFLVAETPDDEPYSTTTAPAHDAEPTSVHTALTATSR